MKAYKFRLYPNNTQKIALANHFGCNRYIYNWALNNSNQKYQKDKTTFKKYDLIKGITQLKKQENTKWLNEVNSQTLQQAIINLDKAFTSFFKKKAKFPKFKNKTNNQSFQVPQNLKINSHNSTITLPKIKGEIKTVFHRTFEGKVKTCTISKNTADQYFISILVETKDKPQKPKKPNKKKAIGIDLGIKEFLITSNGEKVKNPKYLEKSQKRLSKLNRDLSRKKKGSNNRVKARKRLAKAHLKVRNQRTDFLHKESTKLIRENQTIVLEDLNVKGMMKNHKLARSIASASWSEFNRMLDYKAEWYGVNLFRINRFSPSSKMCNSCGHIKEDLKLSDREYKCDQCNYEEDRDINAALNILDFGFHPQSLTHEGVTNSNNINKYSGSGRPGEPVEMSQ